MLDQENFITDPSSEPTEPVEPTESTEPTEPEPQPPTKEERLEILENKISTLEEGLAAAPEDQRKILAELGYLALDSEKTDGEVNDLMRLVLLRTMVEAEKIEGGEKKEEEQDDDSDDDEEELIAKPGEEESVSKLNSHQLAEKMIKDDLKRAFEEITIVDDFIKKNGWDHIHLRTNREQQLVIMTKQEGELKSIMTWEGMELMQHQGLFDIVAHLEQTNHVK